MKKLQECLDVRTGTQDQADINTKLGGNGLLIEKQRMTKGRLKIVSDDGLCCQFWTVSGCGSGERSTIRIVLGT